MRLASISAAVGLSLMAMTPATFADVYIATNWMTPLHILNENPYQRWAKDVKEATHGSIDFEVHSSGSLVPAPTTMQGIRDHVASVGIVFTGYTPSEQPLNNVLNDLAFVADDDLASAMAYTEINLTNTELQQEWLKNGGIFGGGYATPVYNFICMKPIASLQDAKGLRIRTAGGAQVEWVKNLNAIPVSVPIADVYTGLERGSLDCALSDPTNLDKGNKFWEVAKNVNTLPMGVVLGATYIYNPSFWQERTDAERRILLDTMAKGLARSQTQYYIGVQEALKGSKERGLSIDEPDASLSTALENFGDTYTKELAQKSMQTRKISDPSPVIEQYLTLYTKWKDLAKDVDRTNEEAVYELIQNNLYNQIDEKTYGL